MYMVGAGTLWLDNNDARISNNTVLSDESNAVHFQEESGTTGRLVISNGVTSNTVIQGNTHASSSATRNLCPTVLQAGIITLTDLLNTILYSGPFYHLNCN